MACIIRNKQGEVEQVISDNGTPSSLFESLREETGELAEELYQATATPLFKETVIKPKVVRHLRRVREVLNPSRAVKIGISRPVNVQQLVAEGEVTYTNEEGQLCASEGLAGAGFTLGAAWVLAEDLAGEPSHRLGGVDLQFGEDGISYKNNKGEDIKAEDGLFIPEFSEHEWEIHDTENEWTKHEPELEWEIYNTENEWQEYETENEWQEHETESTWEEYETDNEWRQASENTWEIVEDLAGEPSHEEGGVDIQISEDGVTFDEN